MSKKIRPHEKQKWDTDELDRYYQAAITEGRNARWILAHSGKKRTLMSIYTKLWKEFRISRRTAEDGEMYFYLDDAPKKILKRRAKVNKAGSLADVKPSMEIMKIYDLESDIIRIQEDIESALDFVEKAKEMKTLLKYKVKNLRSKLKSAPYTLE
jgi:hypothetical protein